MKPRIAQSAAGDALQGRRRDDSAERARRTEPAVVGHDQQHVGRALGRHDARRPPRLRLGRPRFDHAAEFRVRRRKLIAWNRRGGAGTAHRDAARQIASRRLRSRFSGCVRRRALGLGSSFLLFDRCGLGRRSILAPVSGALRTACGTCQDGRHKPQSLDRYPMPGSPHRYFSLGLPAKAVMLASMHRCR